MKKVLLDLFHCCMLVFPNAKVNLGLNIIEKRTDGYHSLESVFYPVPWLDMLELVQSEHTEFTSSGIMLNCAPQDNLCLKIYEAMRLRYHLPPVKMHLHKNIPAGAGMGGGSSDGTFTVKLLNEVFDLKLDEATQLEIVKSFGSDCAFFVRNQPLLASGKGDVFENVALSLKGKYLTLVYPDLFISTKEAYARVTPAIPKTPLKEVLQSGIEKWKDVLNNDFEKSLFPVYPILKGVKDQLYQAGATYASMSGSGSTLFGIFNEPPKYNFDFPSSFRIWKGFLTV